MSWGSPFATAWNAATDTAKRAAQASAETAKSAYDYVAKKTVQGYEYTKDKAVQGATYAKDKAVQGAIYAKDKAVQGATYAKDKAVQGFGLAKDAAGAGLQVVARVAIEARHLQALGPLAGAKYAYDKAKSELGLNKAGSPVKYCPLRAANCEKLADTLEKAKLAEASYDVESENNIDIGDYKRLNPKNKNDADELSKLGIDDPSELLPKDSDFHAQIFKRIKNGKTEYVVAFRGTAPREGFLNNLKKGANIREDIDQALGMSTSAYSRAIILAKKVSMHAAKQDAAVSYTGHSLGGGMASAAAVSTGNAASTYNAAGLHLNTVGGRIPDDAGKVEAVFSPSDPLSALQDNSDLPKAFGKRHVVPFPDGEKLQNAKDTHGMRLVMEGIVQEQRDAGCVP